MIEEAYEDQAAQRRQAYDDAHGVGAWAARRAANMAVGMPQPRESSPALARPWDRLGFWEFGR